MKTIVNRSSTMPQTDPNEYAYEMDAEEIEREMESAFEVQYDEEKVRWFVNLKEDNSYPHFMACYLIGMQPEQFQEYLKEQFHAETFWESFGAYYITKEQADQACEWMESMHVMASMGGTNFE